MKCINKVRERRQAKMLYHEEQAFRDSHLRLYQTSINRQLSKRELIATQIVSGLLAAGENNDYMSDDDMVRAAFNCADKILDYASR